MKILVLYCSLFIPQLLFCQIEMPAEISVKLYSGGDYRNKDEKGAYDNVDSINYTFFSEFNTYHADTIYQQRKIMLYIDENFNTRNVNEDSTMTIITDLDFPFLEMGNLLYWLDEGNYSEVIFRDTFTFDNDTDEFETIDTSLVSSTISIADFGIDTTDFQQKCDCYKVILEEEKSCDNIDFSAFLHHILKENMYFYSVSSYMTYVSFQLTFNDYKLNIWQKYSGDMNMKWWIDIEDRERLEVLNPHLNSILAKLLPYRNRKIRGLEEYKSKKGLYTEYFRF